MTTEEDTKAAMTNKAKYVCGKLGICWHDLKFTDWPHHPEIKDTYTFLCSKCGLRTNIAPCEINPTFTDPVGIVQLLGLMRKRGDWPEFYMILHLIYHKGIVVKPLREFLKAHSRDEGASIPIPMILDDTGKLLDAVGEWLSTNAENDRRDESGREK
jgi:hypothetical protein